MMYEWISIGASIARTNDIPDNTNATQPFRKDCDQIPYDGLKYPLIEISKKITKGNATKRATLAANRFFKILILI